VHVAGDGRSGDGGRGAVDAAPQRLRYRVLFSKLEDLRWLSHLDLLRTLQRAFKRAGVPVAYSQGYHPAPLMSFGPALAVGVEGAGELFDFESKAELDPEAAVTRLNASLPEHLRVRRLERLAPGAPPLSRCIDLGDYRAWINVHRRALEPEAFVALDGFAFEDPAAHAPRIAALLARPEIVVKRPSGKTVDIRPFIRGVEFRRESGQVRLWLRLGSDGQARPQEVLEALYGAPGTCFRIRREALHAARTLDAAALEAATAVPTLAR